VLIRKLSVFIGVPMLRIGSGKRASNTLVFTSETGITRGNTG